eukprot:1929857-Pyramimonas_sp.AAC.1
MGRCSRLGGEEDAPRTFPANRGIMLCKESSRIPGTATITHDALTRRIVLCVVRLEYGEVR